MKLHLGLSVTTELYRVPFSRFLRHSARVSTKDAWSENRLWSLRWEPFTLVKSSKQGKFGSLCALIQNIGIFLYIPEFHQRLARDLIYVNSQPLNFVEQKVLDAHLLHSFILTEPLSCRNVGSATNFRISDPPVVRKPSSAVLSYLDTKS